jgi:hypothetical protein
MSTTIHANSHAAHADLHAAGTLSKRQALIYAWLIGHPRPWTDREVAAHLRFPDMNCVRPRITELVGMGLLTEVGSVRCPVTGRTVRRVAPVLQQGELPL